MRLAGIIAVAFLGLEMVGIYLLGQQFGLWRTLLWLLTSFILGVAVLSREGSAFMPRLIATLQQGQAPFASLWHSGRRLLAGLLLMFPGLFSDLIAALLLLWPSPPAPPAAARRSAGVGEDGVIEGEFRRED
jgi:UPF0716 protein FxsA